MALRHGLLGAFVGVGIAKTASDLLPAMGAALRPIAKELIRGGLVLADSVHELVAEGKEHLSDLLAEVEHERSGAAQPHAEQTESTAKHDATKPLSS